MKVPQIIIIVLFAFSLGSHLMAHGQPKTGKYNFWTAFLSAAIEIAVLWWGGFFG